MYDFLLPPDIKGLKLINTDHKFITLHWMPSYARVTSRTNDFHKRGGHPKLEVPKLEHAKNFQNHEITGKDSIYSKLKYFLLPSASV